MSLFGTLDLWSTKAGESETFGFHSVIVNKFDESEHNKIVIGSFDGILRIYQITNGPLESTSFKPSDLLLEKQLPESISQIVVGKLVSGSKANHIGVVHPRTISVYSLTTLPGSAEHGSQVELKIIYEHPLQHYNYHVVVGPFGSIKGRDFLCAVAVDGTLSFFEQETFVHEAQLPIFLLPSPVSYVAETDVFIGLTGDWCIAAYKYQDLVTKKKKITATWSFNLGETLLDVQTRRYGQQDTYIVALSEHNVTCFNANGLLKFALRLQYTPLCFHTYVNEHSNNLMMLIVSDCGTLFVYERCILKWSAKLPIIPLSILIVNLGAIDGALVLLSDKGDLNCCFLGTKPTLFVAPPLDNTVLNSKRFSRKLESLQNSIHDFRKKNRHSLLSLNEQKVSVAFKFLPYDDILNHNKIAFELKSSCPISNICVSFQVCQPVKIQPASYSIPALCGEIYYSPVVEIGVNRDLIISKLEVTVVVCYVSNEVPCIIRKTATMWPKFVLRAYTNTASDDECSLKLSLNANKAPSSLSTLFQDLCDEHCVDDESIGICVRYNPDAKCVVSRTKTSHGFNLGSNSIAMLHLIVSQLVRRCRKHDAHIILEYDRKVPKEELLRTVSDFVIARNKIIEFEALLEKICAQYRLIQRRLFVKVRDKTSSNSASLHMLYRRTHEKLMHIVGLLEDSQKNLLLESCNLQAIICLTFELISMGNKASKDTAHQLKTALSPSSLSFNPQDWSERTLAHVSYLLRTNLSTSSQDEYRLAPLSDSVLTDATELVHIISVGLNRLVGDQLIENTVSSMLDLKNDQQRAVSPIPELEENNDVPSRSTDVSPAAIIKEF